MSEALDHQFMQRVFELALKGRGQVSPNALMGAVITRDDEIIGEGFCAHHSSEHAEYYALEASGGKADGAILYLNIEPCVKHRQDVSCVDRIIASGIRIVKIAALDPNPIANGQGVEKLKIAGLDVQVGICEKEARRLNEFYFKYSTTRRPFVTLVSAMSLDGKIATYLKDSENITGEKVSQYIHNLRSFYDAAVVGINTILQDNSQLSCKQIGGREPYRVVVDSHGKTPLNSRVFQRSGPSKSRPHLLIATSDQVTEERILALRQAGADVLVCPERSSDILNPRVDLDNLMYLLGKRGISSVLLEGGGTLNASALNAGIVDKVCFFVAPKLIGGIDAITPVEGPGFALISEARNLKDWKYESLGDDLLIEGYLE